MPQAKQFTIETVFKGVDRMTKPIKGMTRSLQKLSKSAAGSVKAFGSRAVGAVRRFGRAAVTTAHKASEFSGKLAGVLKTGVVKGFKLAATAAAAFGAAFTKIMLMGADFEQTLVRAAVKFADPVKKGSRAYKELEDAALKTGSTTEFTATQSAEALKFLAQAGFTSKQAIAALPGVVDLATNSEIDLAQAADIAAKTLGIFNLKAEDSAKLSENLARVNDVLVTASNSAATDITEVFEAFVKGAPNMGIAVEQASGLVAALADVGFVGESAGTALSGIFSRLKAPTAESQKLIKKYIGSIADSKGNLRPIIDIFADLSKSFEGLGNVEKGRVLAKIFERGAMGPAQKLIDMGSEKLENLSNKMKEAKGSSGAAAKEIRGTLKGSLDSLKSAIEGVLIKLFKVQSSEGIQGVIDKMTAWVNANKDLMVQGVAEFFAGLRENLGELARIFKAIAGMGAAILIIKGIAGAITLVGWALNGTPLGWINILIMAIVAAVGLIIYHWDDITEFFSEFWDGLKLMFDDGVAWIMDIVDAVSGAASKIASFVSGIFGGGGSVDVDVNQGAAGSGSRNQIVTPSDRTAQAITETVTEKRSTQSAEITIKDETGRAKVTKGKVGKIGGGLRLKPSGAF